MYLGIDIGTSSVKALLVDDAERTVAEQSAPLSVERPHALWSEQDPNAWCDAVLSAVDQLKQHAKQALGSVRGIGLSGQMHGATLLDKHDQVLRPAILWNDGRSAAQCETLRARVPDLSEITCNLAMPGFTAPKLLWVNEHEPETFAKIAKVLLPKDYVRLMLSGEYASDMSDAAGTLWIDVRKRAWSKRMLDASHLPESAMPRLYEGSQSTGSLLPTLRARWGMQGDVVIAGGAGDNAAGAVGMGVVRAGQALLSLGTSGVYFVASDRCEPNTAGAVHTFCHALPETWHQMAVMLSAASCLSWLGTLGLGDEAALLNAIETQAPEPGDVIFLPYLSGERTPHNDPHAAGVFFGLRHDTQRAQLARAVLEGVAFGLADGQQALLASGTGIDDVSVIGGGARSRLWGKILASVLARPLSYRAGAELGAAFGAARLARLATTGESPAGVCTPAPVQFTIEPDVRWVDAYAPRLERFRSLYRSLRPEFVSVSE